MATEYIQNNLDYKISKMEDGQHRLTFPGSEKDIETARRLSALTSKTVIPVVMLNDGDGTRLQMDFQNEFGAKQFITNFMNREWLAYTSVQERCKSPIASAFTPQQKGWIEVYLQEHGGDECQAREDAALRLVNLSGIQSFKVSERSKVDTMHDLMELARGIAWKKVGSYRVGYDFRDIIQVPSKDEMDILEGFIKAHGGEVVPTHESFRNCLTARFETPGEVIRNFSLDVAAVARLRQMDFKALEAMACNVFFERAASSRQKSFTPDQRNVMIAYLTEAHRNGVSYDQAKDSVVILCEPNLKERHIPRAWVNDAKAELESMTHGVFRSDMSNGLRR